MWCFHKWETISVEDKESGWIRSTREGLRKVENANQDFFFNHQIIRQRCEKCGRERLESVKY